MQSSYKHQHLESQILNNLNHTMKNEIYDNSLKFCSFTAVKLLPDFSVVNVYVDVYDRNKLDEMINKLTIAKGVFRNQLAHTMNLRKIPDIKFLKDETIDNSLKIDNILSKINRK